MTYHPAGPAESALRPGEDPREKARVLSRVRDVALSGGAPPVAPRPVIGASWRRVRGSGLDPRGPSPAEPLDDTEVHRRRAAAGLAALLPVLRERLLPVADASSQILVVVDAEGRVLWREGGAGVRRRADGLGFVEGSAWDEPSVGTNAIGTSLVEGRPVHVYAGEHWSEGHQPWTCAAAPLHDPLTGRLLGAVDLSGPAHTVHPSTVALVDAVARLAEVELGLAAERALARLRTVAAPVVAKVGGPAVVVTRDGVPAVAAGVVLSGRLVLPDDLAPGEVWLPGLGRWTAEPLLDGWLLRAVTGGPAAAEELARVVVDLTRDPPELRVSSPAGDWRHALTPRHAEVLAVLARHPGGRSAAELAADLFGDAGLRVTVRAEMSRLRRTLGPLLRHQPYRFAAGVAVELVDRPGQ